MRVIKKLLTLATVGSLAACGGSNEGPASAATVAALTAEGYWTGFTSAGWATSTAILETGETWSMSYSGSTIYNALSGKTTWTTTALTGTGTEFFMPARSVVASTYSGTYTKKASLKSQTSGGVGATLTYAPLYDAPASLTAVAGSYTGQGVTAKSSIISQPLTITNSGSLTGGVVDCAITGVLLPRAAGKGIFNLFINLEGKLCPTGTVGSMQGIAVFDPSSNRLVVMTTNTDKKDGFFFVGSR